MTSLNVHRRQNLGWAIGYNAVTLPARPCTEQCVSAGQQMHVQDKVDEIERLLSRSFCWGDSYAGISAGRRVREQLAGGR